MRHLQRSGISRLREDPDKFKGVVTPVLKKIVAADPDRRGAGLARSGAARESDASSDRAGPRRERPAEGSV